MRRVLLAIVFLSVLGLVAQAEMIVTTADGSGADTFVGNDSNKGPNNNYGSSGAMDIRNYANTRAHIGIARWDITSIGGVDPAGVQLQLYVNQGGAARTWNVYGLNDRDAGEAWNEGTITYNTAPGLLPTTPQANGTYLIDDTRLTLLGTIPVTSAIGLQTFTVAGTDPNVSPLASFIKDDTNNLLTLVLIAQGGDRQYYVASKEGAASDPNRLPPRLVLSAVADPFWASNPTPGMHQVVSTSLNQLSWTNPEPNSPGGVITCDVYFGTTEPNTLEADYGLQTLATGTTATSVSLPTALTPFAQYYWVIDVHDSSLPGITHYGRHWSFNTFNETPSVNVGADQFIWLPDNATATVNATVTDDGLPGPVSYLWEQVSGPVITISPNNTEDITQVFTEAGSYVLRLTADDGAAAGSDTLLIYVGTDPCDAAQAVPGYNGNDMDFNGDCFVDILDFADFAAEWLDCTSLECPGI